MRHLAWATVSLITPGVIGTLSGNHIENQIRPIAIGRNNWLFAGSLRAGKRGAAGMGMIRMPI